jgi:hypothetical protein
MRILLLAVNQGPMPYSACQIGQTVSYLVSVMMCKPARAKRQPLGRSGGGPQG